MGLLREIPRVSGIQEQREALLHVLRSDTFTRNARLAALLEYLCERSFQADGEVIKEYSIATDVFGRSANFDQSTDAIVRVEMHRLRKKLREYYAGEGINEALEIVLQSGNYVPEFVVRGEAPPPVIPELRELAPAPEPAILPGKLPEPALESLPETTYEIGATWTNEPVIPVEKPVALAHRRLWSVLGALCLVLIGAGIAVGVMTFRHNTRYLADGSNGASTPLAALPPGETVRILCGSTRSGMRDHAGNVWGADAYFTGGSVLETPEQPIYRTLDPFIYRSMRTGDFSYDIPLKPGVYELRLHFADTSYTVNSSNEGGENLRVFDVLLNGKMLLPEFDIMADAGPNTADVRVFKDVSPSNDGRLHLSFVKQPNLPVLSGIEIVPGMPHRMRPVRIAVREFPFTDAAGRAWLPDSFFSGGRTIARMSKLTGPEDTQIFERERYGNFSYAIPVADGSYALKLYLAETYWGASGQQGKSVGTRIFDVYCNGEALIRNLDMCQLAGPNKEILKIFHGLHPNGQGKLLVSFVPVKNYANVSAIEVTDESDSQ